MIKLGILVALAALSGVWAFKRWNRAIQLVMVLLVLEGALRKWVFPGAQDALYFAKDGLLLAAYAGYWSHRGQARTSGLSLKTPLLVVLIGLSAFLGLIQIFNPDLPNLWVGLFGFKAYFLYIPLLWLVPASFSSREELWRFLYLYVILVVPLGLLALAQFASPSTSTLNGYARGGSTYGVVATFGSSTHVRATGTFSYITGFVSYLYAVALMILSLLSTVRWRLRGYTLAYVAMALTLVGMLASGSRAPVLMFAVTFPLFWWFVAAGDQRSRATFGRILFVAVIFTVALSFGTGDVVGAFYGRAQSTQDLPDRILAPWIEPIRVLQTSGPLGIGIGATHQAASALVDDSGPPAWLNGMILEGESGRVMLEVGLLGFLLVYGVRVAMIVIAFQQSLRLQDRFCRSIAISCTLFFLAHLPAGIIFDVTASLYFWFFGGLLFLVVRLDRECVASSQVRRAAPESLGGRPAFASPLIATRKA